MAKLPKALSMFLSQSKRNGIKEIIPLIKEKATDRPQIQKTTNILFKNGFYTYCQSLRYMDYRQCACSVLLASLFKILIFSNIVVFVITDISAIHSL